MVVEVDTRKKLSPFFEYNLFQEADDSKPSNMKVIDLKLSDKRRRDYTKDSEITMDDDEEVDTPEEPITDDEDYTADADNPPEDGGEEGEAQTTDSETPDQGEDQSGEGEDDKVEQMYKYNLYQKFKNVYTSLDEYIDEINTITSDDGELNREYKELSIK